MSSHSSSLLSELKSIASEAAEREKSQPTQSLSGSITPQPRKLNTGSSKFTLSDALADVHGLVDEEARAEKKRRERIQEVERSNKEAQRAEEERRYQAEVAARVAAEEARRVALEEEKRLAKLRADYEAAVARGEAVEMPAELRPPEPTPPPQAIAPPMEVVVAPPPPNRKPLIFGGVVAALAAGVLVYVLASSPDPQPVAKPEIASSVDPEPIQPVKSEAEILREKIAAQLAAEQKRKEEEQRKAQAALAMKRAAKKKPTVKKKPKKDAIKLSLDGF